MLKPSEPFAASELDRLIFDKLVPLDHYLRQVKAALDFERLRPVLTPCYDLSLGRPAIDPVLMVKFQFLQFHYNLSDRAVVAQAQVNVAYRFFLDLSLDSPLPDPSLFSVFRQRVGQTRYQEIFASLVEQAREMGLVKDRLRLKDATHVIANIAIPSTIGLVAQVRQHLLEAANPFVPEWVEEQNQRVSALRTATADLPDEQRLLHRVNHLRELVAFVKTLDERLQTSPATDATARARLQRALQLAEHLLADQDDPEKGDRLISGEDPDARFGYHHGYFPGYLLDISEDADSELLTGVHILPGNGDEGADATALIEEEEKRHGNDVEGLSIDGAGHRGELLREWQDKQGLDLDVTVPVPPLPQTQLYGPERFPLTDDGETVTCPAGQTGRKDGRNNKDTGTKFRFPLDVCNNCTQRGACIGEGCRKTGRSVIKNDYEPEYQAARTRAGTEAHAATRREHPRVERKLAEIVRWHGGRRARYRGLAKVAAQFLLTTVVVNVKRIVRLLGNAGPAPILQGA
jgi:transposase